MNPSIIALILLCFAAMVGCTGGFVAGRVSAGETAPRGAPDSEGSPALLGAPPDGPPAPGKGTLGDAGNGQRESQTDNGNAAGSLASGAPLKLPGLDPQGLDHAGPSHGGAPLIPRQDPGEAGGGISAVVIEGIASYVNAGLGPRYLALPDGPGIRVVICSPETGRCVTRVSTDAGPDLQRQREGRVADLSFEDFRYLCRCTPRFVGLIPVTVSYGGAAPTLPATSTELELP